MVEAVVSTARLRAVVFAGLVHLSLIASAIAQTAETPTPVPANPPVEAPTLGRDVPRGAVGGFLDACERGLFDEAATFLNLRRPNKALGKIPPPIVARDLCAIVDRTLAINLSALSDAPEGYENDDLPRGTDSIGTITTETGPVQLLVERVRDHDSYVWVIAAATVAQTPRLYQEFGYGLLGHWLPPFFFELRFLGVQLWQWLGLFVLLPASWLLSRPISRLMTRLGKFLARRTKTPFDDALIRNAEQPLRVVVGALLFEAGTQALALGVRAQGFVTGARQVLSVIAISWLIVRLTDVFAGMIVERRHQAAAFMPLGRRTVKAVAVSIAIIASLRSLGFDVSSLLAGLGIGGLAVALASQKTVEHLFGGVTLIADQPVRVGDLCKFGDKTGTVEDIGLRSTRIRTADRTLVSVPNGEFSTMQIENLSRRDRMRLQTVLRLRYETSADQLRQLIMKIHDVIVAGTKIDAPSVQVRFVGFAAYSLDIELTAYVKTTNADEFATIREDLFLSIMDLISAAGTGFAFPSQTIYSGTAARVEEGRPAEMPARSADGEGSMKQG